MPCRWELKFNLFYSDLIFSFSWVRQGSFPPCWWRLCWCQVQPGANWAGLGTSECGKTRWNLEPIRTNAVWEGRGPPGLWESDISYPYSWFYLNQAKPHSQISELRPLCKWQNQQTGNDWFQWLHWWRTPQCDSSADLPSASVENCSPLLKTVSNRFGPLFFILISSQAGNNSFLHLHSYCESIYRW